MRSLPLRAVMILLIPLLLLIGSSVASAADNLSVHLPSATHTKSLQVSGRAPVGATVTSPLADKPVTADALGWFALKLNLAEGSNKVTVTATKAGSAPLTWSGTVNVNSRAPALTVTASRSTNLADEPIYGYTVPGATVTVNGTAVNVDAKGYFWYRLELNMRDTEYTVVTKDPSGNRSEYRSVVLFSNRHAWFNIFAGKITYSAPVGSQVLWRYAQEWYDPQQTLGLLKLDERGIWESWVTPKLGWNLYFMQVTAPEGITYTDKIGMVKFLEIDMPELTTRETVNVPGQTLPGYKVTLNDKPVVVNPDGSFKLTLQLRPGTQDFRVKAVDSTNANRWSQRIYTVMRLSPQDPVYSSGITLNRQEPDTIFFVGSDRYTADSSGQAVIPLKLNPGSNTVLLPLLTPGGDRRFHLFDVTYIPSTFIKLTIDKGTAEVNGDLRTLTAPPVMLEGNTYVPLRFLGELLGAKVEWEQVTKTVTYTKGSRVLQLTIGSTTARVDGKEVLLPAPPRLVNNSTLVPLRFISESLGAKVSWDGVTRSITLMVPVQ